MSRKQPFAGKWQARLDNGQINTLIGAMDGGRTSIRGQSMIVYKTGEMVPFSYLYKGIVQLQPDGVTPTKPAALGGSYLSPVPYSGNIYRPNGISAGSGAQVWMYNDSYQYPSPSFAPSTNPASGAVFAWWPSLQVWGWLNSSSPPAQGQFEIVIKAPSAFHLHNHQTPIDNGDYTWCDLSGEDYSQLSMRGAVFAGADLSGTDFSGTDLTGADFRGVSSLAGAVFTGATLSNARFDGLDLTAVKLSGLTMKNASLAGTKLAGASLTGSDLSGTDFHVAASLAGADVTNADLTGCRFDGMDLTGFSFPGARLTEAGFAGAVLDKAQFVSTSQQRCDLSGLDFTKPASVASARFSALLHQTVFSGMDLTGLDFTGADTTGTRFDGCDLREAAFSVNPTWSTSIKARTVMTGAAIKLAQLGLNWSNVDLTGAVVEGLEAATDLSQLQARGAILTDFSFNSRNMQKCDFANADLRGAIFAKSNLSYSSFNTALLTGPDDGTAAASFTGAVLTSCDFTSAELSGATFDSAFFTGTVKFAGASVRSVSFAGAYLVGADFSGVADKQFQGSSFHQACLANASFAGAILSDDQGKRLPISNACLQGADFTEADLYAADLTSSAVSSESGSLNVTVMHNWPLSPYTMPIKYGPTKGIEEATGTTTVCPSTALGPCQGDKLVAKDAPTTQWP